MTILAVVLLAAAIVLGYRAITSTGDSSPPNIEAMMPKTGQAQPVSPDEVAGAPKGVLPGEKH